MMQISEKISFLFLGPTPHPPSPLRSERIFPKICDFSKKDASKMGLAIAFFHHFVEGRRGGSRGQNNKKKKRIDLFGPPSVLDTYRNIDIHFFLAVIPFLRDYRFLRFLRSPI